MAIERGNLIACANRAMHHCNWTAFLPSLSPIGKNRVESIEDALLKIRDGLMEIKQAADNGDITAIRAIMGREFTFGKEL